MSTSSLTNMSLIHFFLRSLVALFVLSCGLNAQASTELKGRVVGVLPILGSEQAASEIVKALRGYEGLEVVSLAKVESVLGSESAKALSQCTADPCKISVLRPLKLGLFVDGELSAAARGQNLRLRLVSTSTSGSEAVKVTANQLLPENTVAGLRLAVLDAAASLFAEFGLQGFGTLTVMTNPEGATVVLNDEIIGASPVGPVRVPQGRQRLRIEHPGHKPWDGFVQIKLGETAKLEAELIMNRSELPFYLGTGAFSLAVTGLMFGLHASSVANRWDDACAEGVCTTGFSAQRHYDDVRLVDAERNIANGLFTAAIGFGVSALTVYLLDDGSPEVQP